LSNHVSYRKQGCFEIEKNFSPAADVSSRRTFNARVTSAWMTDRAFTTPSQLRSPGHVFSQSDLPPGTFALIREARARSNTRKSMAGLEGTSNDFFWGCPLTARPYFLPSFSS